MSPPVPASALFLFRYLCARDKVGGTKAKANMEEKSRLFVDPTGVIKGKRYNKSEIRLGVVFVM